jgi:predicted RND superfamily exporter protein
VGSADLFNPETLEAISKLTDFLDFHPYITQVRSLMNYQYIHADGDDLSTDYLIGNIEEVTGNQASLEQLRSMLPNELLAIGTLITEDFRHTRIVGRVEYRAETSEHKVELVEDLYQFIEAEDLVSDNYALHLSGYPLVYERFETVSAENTGFLVPIMIVLMLAILYASFRSWSAALFPWLVIASGLLLVLEIQSYLGIPHTTIDSSALPSTLIIIGIGITVHVLVEFFQFQKLSGDSVQAAHSTIVHLWLPAFFTAITTSAGFYALSVTKIMPIREFALLGAIGPLILFFFSLSVLPAMLSYTNTISDKTQYTLGSGIASRITQKVPSFTLKHRNKILSLGAIALLLSVLYLPNVQVDTNYVTLFKQSSVTRQDIEYFDDVFHGMMTLDIVLDSGAEDGIKHPDFLRQMDTIQSWLGQRDALGPVNSVVDYLKEINQALNADDPAYFRITDSPEMTAQFLLLYDSSGANEDLSDIKDFDNRYGRLVIPVKNMPASEMQTELDSITAYMNNNYSQLQPLLTGTMALKTVQDIYVSEGMVLSFSIALLVISILFIVLFRSIKYGLLSIVPSILPIILTASVASFMGIYMDQSTMIVGAMTMGIAVDDAIHVMNRYLVAKKSIATTQQSIEQAMNESGRAVLLSSMVLVCFALPALPP